MKEKDVPAKPVDDIEGATDGSAEATSIPVKTFAPPSAEKVKLALEKFDEFVEEHGDIDQLLAGVIKDDDKDDGMTFFTSYLLSQNDVYKNSRRVI